MLSHCCTRKPLRRCAFHCGNRFCARPGDAPDHDEFSARSLDRGLSLRRELGAVFVRILHVNFRDEIDRSFSLRVQPLNCDAADRNPP